MAKPWEQDWSVSTAPAAASSRPPWEQDWSVEDRAPEDRGPLRAAGDFGLEVVSGGLKGIKFISDAFGADNPISSGLAAAGDFVKSLQSERAQTEDRRVGEIMRAAEDQGALEQIKAALSAAGEAPVRQSLGALATGLPVIAASLVPGLREASWGARLAALGTVGAVQGAGTVKSSIYDGVYERARQEGRSDAEARALAEQAQSYEENPELIAGGAGLGAAASATGFQPAIAQAVSRAGALTTARAAGSTFAKEVGMGVLKEVPLEALQGGQEQYATNVAQDRAGFETPPMRGVVGGATLGGVLSVPGGAIGGAVDYRAERSTDAAQPPATSPALSTIPATPDSPASTPEARLAELSLLAESRALMPEEVTELRQLLSGPAVDDGATPDAPVASIDAPAAPLDATAGDANILPADAAPAPPADAAAPADGQDLTLQNRDRSRAASVVQMQQIARDPDYLRLGPSRTPDSGAPMIFAVGDETALAIPPDAFGREDVAVMSDGQRVPFRYAVVDAMRVQPSNFADGRANSAFASTETGTLKALNNGRTAGLRAAYEQGSAARYSAELLSDAAAHGVKPEAIARTAHPMLVRVYPETANTKNMAAKSQGQGLGMGAAELARQDAPLLDSGVLSAYQGGDVTAAANRDFVRAFVGKLVGAGQDVATMVTAEGTLSPDGRKRIQAALVQAAYDDAEVVADMFESTETDIKAIGEALKQSAGQWANMRDSARLGAIDPQQDITPSVVAAVGLVRRSRRERVSLYDLARQPDLMTGETPSSTTLAALRLFYGGQYLTRPVGREKLAERLQQFVQYAMATSADAGMFADAQPTAIDILQAITEERPTDGQADLATEQRDTEPGQQLADASAPMAADRGGEPEGGGGVGGLPDQVWPAGQRPGDGAGGRGPAAGSGGELADADSAGQATEQGAGPAPQVTPADAPAPAPVQVRGHEKPFAPVEVINGLIDGMSGPDRIADPKLRKAVVDAGMVSKAGTTARGWELIRQLKEIEGADATAAQQLIDQAIGRQPFDKPKRSRGAAYRDPRRDADAGYAAEAPRANYGAPSREAIRKAIAKVKPFDAPQANALANWIGNRPDVARIVANLKEHAGTPWARQSLEGALTRAAIEEYVAGRKPDFDSFLNAPTAVGMRELLERAGADGAWAYLAREGVVGDSRKPINSVSSSFIDCNPSKDCASFCYAAKGNFAYGASVRKSELMTWAAETDPVRLGQLIASEYATTLEFQHQKALRLFDKGDGTDAWLSVIKTLNEWNGPDGQPMPVRVQVFSKNPGFLRQVPAMNLRMLSADKSNVEVVRANPDLPVAFVYTDASQVEFLNEIKDRVQVILPIKQGVRILDQVQIDALPTWTKPVVCPVDDGRVKIGPNRFKRTGGGSTLTTDKGLWNCTRCDKNGGVGCFHGSSTERVVAAFTRPIHTRSSHEIDRIIRDIEAFSRRRPPGERAELLGSLDRVVSAIRAGIDTGTEGTGRAGDDSRVGADDGWQPVRITRRRDAKEGEGGAVASPPADYDHGYTQDLFGDSLPETDRETVAAGGDTLRRVLDGRLDADAPLPGEGRFATEVVTRAQSALRVGYKSIVDAAQAAHAFAHLAKYPREYFAALVVDAKGRPLAYWTGFMGSSTMTSVYPAEIAKLATSVPGAAGVWVAHNHPSGTPNPSRADEMLTTAVGELLRGIVPLRGSLVIAGRRYTDIASRLSGGQAESDEIPEARRNVRVPMAEREFLRAGTIDETAVSSPRVARAAVEKYLGTGEGMLLLSAQNELIGVLPYAVADGAQTLRDSGEGRRLMQLIARTGTQAVILRTKYPADGPQSQRLRNLLGLFNSMDVRPLDVFDLAGTSYSERGANLAHSSFADLTPSAERATGALAPEVEPAFIPAATRLAPALKQWEAGKISNEQMLERVRAEIERRQDRRHRVADRVRGADWLRERLIRARRTGELSAAQTDLALWLIERAPQLAEDLGISIREGDESNPNGTYNVLARIATIFSSKSNDDTAAHEILHHTERMMPAEVQAGTRREWLRQLRQGVSEAKERLAGGTGSAAAQRARLDWMLEAAERGADTLALRLWKGFGEETGGLQDVLPYQLAAASEFWAVNAARIMRDRFTARQSWVQRARQWLRELLQKAMALFGLPSDAAVLRGLRAVKAGDGSFVSPTMISELRELEDRPAPAGPTLSPPQNPWQHAKARVAALTGPEAIDRLIYEFQDKFVDLKRIRDHLQAIGGAVTDLNDAYLGEELYHKRLAKRTQDFIADELRPLLSNLKAADIPLPEFERFLHARHAPEANRVLAERNPNEEMIDAKRAQRAADVHGLELQLQSAKANGAATRAIEQALDQAREEAAVWSQVQAFRGTEEERLALSGMSDAEAAAVMDGLPAGQRQHLEALAARVDAINARTLELLERYGLMDRASLDAWRRTYQFYVPLHRDEAHPDTVAHPIGQGFSVKGEAARSRTGSTQKVTHILGHIAMQREAALTRGEKNRVVKQLYLLVAQNPDETLWAVDEPPMVRSLDRATGTVRTHVDPTYKHRPNVLMLRAAGRDVAITFNEHNPQALRLAEAMKNLDVGDLHVVLDLTAKGTRWFASVNTQYNPIFGVINFLRDVQSGLLNLSTTPLAGAQRQVLARVPAAMRAIYRATRDKTPTDRQWAALWADLQEVGGTTGYRDLFVDAADRSKALEREMAALNRGQAKRAAMTIVDWLSDYNETMENAVRLAAYKVALDRGLTKERAASLAKNLTVNFNRKGRQARELGALYAFFNASVQGTARMVETLRGPLGKRVMAGGVSLGALSALLGMSVMGGGDDDEWEKIPEFVKERSVIIPLGRKEYVSLPMPLGFHVLPNIGRLAVEFMLGRPEKTAARQLGNLLMVMTDAFNPMGGAQNLGQMISPTVIDPAVALVQNRDWTGRPIYREDLSSLDPTPGPARTKDSASTFSKVVAEMLNRMSGGTEFRPGAISWSPDAIDYVMGQLTGGLGRELIKLNQAVTAPFTGEELPTHKIPLLGRIYGTTRGASGEGERFYENVREINEIENEVVGNARRGRDVQAILDSEPLAALIGAGNAAETQVRRLRTVRRDVLREGLPDSQAEVRRINEQVGEVMADLNRQVRRARRGPVAFGAEGG